MFARVCVLENMKASLHRAPLCGCFSFVVGGVASKKAFPL